MDPLTEKLVTLLEPVVIQEGFELVRVRMTGSSRPTLQVMAERPDGTMSAGDCEQLSRALSPLLEETDPIDGNYNLEVSSPGIDRPLTRLKDYERWEGFDAKLELVQMMEGRKRFRGILAGIEAENVCIDLDGEEETTLIPFSLIAQGKLVLTDDLVRESLRAAKAAEVAEKNGQPTDPENPR